MNWIKWMPLALLLTACGVYNFKGSNIPTEVETFSVAMFSNEAQIINPKLSLDFTEKVKTKFQSETKLGLVNENGHWQFSGAIREYKIEPAIIDQTTAAAQNQFTITVKVNFENTVDETKNFTRDFSFFRTYDATKDFSSVENDLSSEICDNIVQQIFAATALEW
jgi:hypothetical protein